MTPFAELNTAMNVAIVNFLADAVADFGSGVTVAGLFTQKPSEAFGIVAGNRPIFEACSVSLASVSEGTAVRINDVDYVVAEITEDAGMTAIHLELA